MPLLTLRPTCLLLPKTLSALVVIASAGLVSVTVSNAAFAHGGGLEEVIVMSARGHRTLDDSALRVEVLGEEELHEKANMKPGDIRMMLNESTGIQVQQSSATSFNSTVRIQGLDGRYTQTLRDGLPIYSGFSSGLSLLQITPLDLKQVEVVKGASSTLYGGGAIAGLVNLVSKTPQDKPESAVLLNATSAGGQDLSAFHSRQAGQHGLTLFGSYNRNDAYEAADNGLSAIPEFERTTLTPRWFYSASEQTQFDLGLGLVNEQRLGGSMNYIQGRAQNEYFEENKSRRAYLRLGLEHSFDNELEFKLKHTNSNFDRSLEIPDYRFSGLQTSSFSELSLGSDSGEHAWLIGLNALQDKFDQDTSEDGFVHDYQQHSVGAFAQYTQALSATLSFDAGLRIDQHSDYGEFVLPRFAFLYTPTHELSLRLGGGLGYKTPTLFITDAEEQHFENIQPINSHDFDAETSSGLNFDINHRFELNDEFTLNGNFLLFYTKISKPVELVDQGNYFAFEQHDNNVHSKGLESNLIFSWHELSYVLGYTYVDAKQNKQDKEQPLALVSKHRLNQVLLWEREDDFRIGLEAYYFSPQQREQDSTGESYWIFGLMTEKSVSESLGVFLNFENFTDTRQSKFENINNGDLVNPDFRDIYAPLDGFVINGGIRLHW
ncbi:TonB-dependent receptor plug domain-containing protein [Agaribacterium haliotis]|uniref:TonB-dependent receptor plug domain-containing protein n=1 Tax=Agaribacterium haliotis TaxID=2013869 RepID=UPI000BB55AFA|nr:TonB-dependent receptor [Agaribacterium haliotis]